MHVHAPRARTCSTVLELSITVYNPTACKVRLVQTSGDRTSLTSLLEAGKNMQAKVLEHVIGLDYIIPGTLGAARATVWVSPQRREAMAEIRLF